MIASVKISEEDTFIEVIVDGSYSYNLSIEDLIDVWKRATVLCKEVEKYKILAHWNLEGQVSLLTGYELGANPVELFGWDRRIKIAAIHKEQSAPAQELYHFVQTAAYNRGFHFKSFKPLEKEEALIWLKESAQEPSSKI